jgi:CheY-like chemotaxis protein
MEKSIVKSDRNDGRQTAQQSTEQSSGAVPSQGADAGASREQDARKCKLRVAIVEDNSAAREMMKALLELDGVDVSAAADGNAGLEMILKERPDLAIVDIGLPDLDGHQVARRIRESLPKGEIHLVALTGYGLDEDRRAALEAGFDDHFVKPLKIDDLRRLLRVLRETPAK